MKIPLKQYAYLLADYLKPQKGRVTLLAITLLSSIALQVLNPQILSYFIDTAVAGGSQQALLTAALAFIVVALVTQVLIVAATYFGENVAWTATNELRADLVEHCLSLDLSFHKSRTPGELVERVDGDVNNLSRFFSQFTIYILGNALLLMGIMVALFFEDWRAGFALTLFTITALVTLIRLSSYAVPYWHTYSQISAEFFGFLGEKLNGTEDLRANGAVSYVMHRFYRILQRWLPVYHQVRFAGTILWGTSIGLFTLGNALALAIGAYLWSIEAITIGNAYIIFYYTNLLSQPIERIREELEELQKAEASILRIRELFSIQPRLSRQLKPSFQWETGVHSRQSTDGKKPLPDGSLSVTLENVSFSYDDDDSLLLIDGKQKMKSPGKDAEGSKTSSTNNLTLPTSHPEWALQNISFHLPPGQVLGLLGRTGSGKTTLARLLLRLYDPQSGSIHLGGVAIETTPLGELPQRVGLVTQDIQLFQTTIRNNLTFFNRKISDESILDILEVLGLSTWLQSLPRGLDTQLGSDSGGLSAGQAQLLAFARVFLKDPGLVILDEASSRLDPTTEKLIERAVDRLLEGRTGVIIAHRLATVQRADKILILDKGRMVEFGDRQELAQDPNSRLARLLKTGLRDILA
jgi:ATP-binding cassette subfamily B protein/ATP-binding cassette subfamily C protein